MPGAFARFGWDDRRSPPGESAEMRDSCRPCKIDRAAGPEAVRSKR